MPIFEVEHGAKTYEVDAPDMDKALAGFQAHIGGNAPPEKASFDDRFGNGPMASESPIAAGKAPEMSPMQAGLQRFAEANDPRFAGQQQARRTMGALGAGQEGILQGLTFGFGDELMAGAMTPIEAIKGAITGQDAGKDIGQRFSDAYTRKLEQERGKLDVAREEYPIATGIGSVAGGLTTGGNLAKGGVTLLNIAKPTVPKMVGAGAAEGAIYGGLYGAGEGEGVDDRLAKAGRGAAIGTLVGGGLGAIGARGAQKAAEKAVPDAQGLKAASNALYKQAEDVGLVLKPQSFAQNVDDIAATVAEAGIDRSIHPRASAALARLEEAKGQPITLKQFDVLRRVLGAAAKSNEPDERRIASIMIDKLDDYLANVSTSEVISGNPKMASGLIENARNLWARARKTDLLDEMSRRVDLNAQMFSGSGRENAIRTEFRNLAKRSDFKRMFSPAEQAAVERVAKGGPVENGLRLLGKLAPTGVVSGIGGMAIGNHVAGPVGAVAAPVMGGLARAGATALTGRNVKAAELLIRNGGVMPTAGALSGPQRAMIDLLMKGSSPQGTSLPNYAPMSLSELGRMTR
ncbi:hypothetical protein [Microvirga alba]|uniref:Uncharacterized protein n=1 Tax=Microvirga alba TaxID=2791025 RepID=A0A931FRL6_9HYPH|nr:hypothetical protein [Microvirga alba]MBF9234683.1 hypothetical protein [Microvirga alba]